LNGFQEKVSPPIWAKHTTESLKSTGRKLNVFKGNVPKAELDERWQELAWRVNFGFHKDSAITGEMLIAFFQSVRESRMAAAGNHGELPAARRAAELLLLEVPKTQGQNRRFPAKRTAPLKETWRVLQQCLKSDARVIELPRLTKQQRWYAHSWAECWIGVNPFLHGTQKQSASCTSVVAITFTVDNWKAQMTRLPTMLMLTSMATMELTDIFPKKEAATKMNKKTHLRLRIYPPKSWRKDLTPSVYVTLFWICWIRLHFPRGCNPLDRSFNASPMSLRNKQLRCKTEVSQFLVLVIVQAIMKLTFAASGSTSTCNAAEFKIRAAMAKESAMQKKSSAFLFDQQTGSILFAIGALGKKDGNMWIHFILKTKSRWWKRTPLLLPSALTS
jgi:hypothetical protein